MKFITALKYYFSLNVAQRQFVKLSKRKFNMPQKEIVNFLKPMAAFDQECDLAINQVFKINMFCLLFMVIGAFTTNANAEAGMIIAGVSFFSLIAGIFARIILGNINIHNSLRELVLPLVNTIGEDAAPDKNMQLSLDLTGKLLKAKMVLCNRVDPGWFSYPKVTTSIYQDNWLDLQTELVDGSKVHVSIKDRITSRNKTYKAISGKIKTKTKNKLKQFIRGTVSLRNKKYDSGNPLTLQNQCDRFKAKEGENRNSFTMTRIIQHYREDAYPSPEICIDLIGKVFMNVQPAARGSK